MELDVGVKLELTSIVAFNLPKLEKRSKFRLGVQTRALRVSCSVGQFTQDLPWKQSTEKIEWLESRFVFPTVSKTSTIYFEVYAKHTHGDHARILQSKHLAVESLIGKKNHHISIELDHGSTSGKNSQGELISPSDPTITFMLSASHLDETGVSSIKRTFAKRLAPREQWASLVEPLQNVLQIALGAGVEPTARIALTCVMVACDTFLKPFELDDKVLELMEEIESTLHLIFEVSRTDHTAASLTVNQRRLLPALMHQVNECILFIHEYSSQSYLRIVAKALVTNYASIVAEFLKSLHCLREQFRDSELWNTQVVVHRVEAMLNNLDQKMDNLQLDKLQIAKGSGRDPLKICLDGTRVEVLDTIHSWIHGGRQDSEAQLVLLIIGQAGVGKSAIAHTIAHQYAKIGRLGSAFCFSKERDSAHVFRTIARSLADLDAKYASALSKLITSETAMSESLEIQMTDLLLPAFDNLSLIGPIVLVIDALDECNERNVFVECLVKHHRLFPANIRILVTSRPTEAMKLRKEPWIQVLDLENESTRNVDVLLYVQTRLKPQEPEKTFRGLSSEDVKLIASSSEGLFQYASVVCDEIIAASEWTSTRRESPKQTFTRLVKDSQGGLDSLYTRILENAYPNPHDSDALDAFRDILGWILAAQDRLTHSALVDFGRHQYVADQDNGEGYDRVSLALRPLGALLSGTQDVHAVVYPLHSSVRNFLLDEQRSHRFFVGPETNQHSSLASVLLQLLVAKGSLRFNIANLENSYIRNSQVPDFQRRTEATVSGSLLYACKHWATHLRLSLRDQADFDGLPQISLLLNQKYLFWIEVLGLTRATSSAETALQFLRNWIKFPNSTMSQIQISSYLTFIREYALVIEETTPHLYISALVFSPEFLSVSHLKPSGLPTMKATFKSASGASDPSFVTGHGHEDSVNSVCFVPDGTLAVSASNDKTIRVWSTEAGTQVGKSIAGHDGHVVCVSVSPDGSKIVSASRDMTIRVWNLETGAQVGESYLGHEGWIRSAFFSPDGKCIASASDDKTVRVWSTEIKLPRVKHILRGHTSYVLHASFSPDGNHIVSASHDYTCRVWNVESGSEEFRLNGHTAMVRSASYSPDGSRVVSASSDYTIGVWDVSKKRVVKRLLGHTSDVLSAFFSSDGTRIVSASSDETIRIWDAVKGEQIAVLSGHASWVRFACFSPDGSRIASASNDNTLRIWKAEQAARSELTSRDAKPGKHDARQYHAPTESIKVGFSPSGKSVVAVLQDRYIRLFDTDPHEHSKVDRIRGQEGRISSAAFSPDGHLLVSTSNRVLELWNTETGARASEPLHGHGHSICSASFSPNGRLIVSASYDRTIRLWNVETGTEAREPLRGHGSSVNSASFSADGNYIISASLDQTVRVWDAETGDQVGEPLQHPGNVTSASFSPNGKLIVSTTSADEDIRVWSADTGALLRSLRGHGPSTGVSTATFSSDSKHIVSASKDKTVRVWDVETGIQIGEPLVADHDCPFHSACFSPDGKQIVAGGKDTVLLFQLSAENDEGEGGQKLQDRPPCIPVFDKASGRFETPTHDLLLWVPKAHRGHIRFSSLIRSYLYVPPGVIVVSNWEKALHGTEWAKGFIEEEEL